MKIFLSLFFLFTYYNFSQVYSQREEQIDSLKTEIKTADIKDKVEIYRLLSKLNFLHNTDVGLNYANKSLKIAKDVGDVIGIAKAYEMIGINYSVKAEFDSCEINLKKALELFETLEEHKKVSDVLIVLGINQINQYKFDNAIEFLNQAIENLEANKIQDGLASAYVNIGNAMMGSTKYEEAIEKYFEAVKQFKKEGSPERVIEPYVNIGNAFFHLKDYENAIKYYNITLEHSDTNDLSQHKSILLNNIGEVYIAKKKFNKSVKYLIEALDINRKIGNKRFISMNLCNLGDAFMKQGNFQKAKNYIDEAILVASEINSNELLTLGYFNNGILNKLNYEFEKSNNRKNLELLKQSVDFLLKAEEKANITNDIRYKIDIYYNLAEVFNLKEENDLAYNYLKKYIYLEDSLNNAESIAKVISLESSKDNELKSQEIEYLKKENKYKSQLNYLLILISVLGVLILYFIYYRYKVKHDRNMVLEKLVEERTKELTDANEKIKHTLKFEKEVSDIKTNIILNISHQFRTPLTAISSYIEILKLKSGNDIELSKPIENAQKSIKELVNLIDDVEHYHSTHISDSELDIKENKILDIVNDAINKTKHKYNSNNEIIINNNLSFQTINTDFNLLSESLFNIIDNAIKFSDNYSKIEINLFESDGKIKFEVIDNGEGINEDELVEVFDPLFVGKNHIGLKKGNGLGLTISKTNIDKLGGTIYLESNLSSGTKVTIVI